MSIRLLRPDAWCNHMFTRALSPRLLFICCQRRIHIVQLFAVQNPCACSLLLLYYCLPHAQELLRRVIIRAPALYYTNHIWRCYTEYECQYAKKSHVWKELESRVSGVRVARACHESAIRKRRAVRCAMLKVRMMRAVQRGMKEKENHTYTCVIYVPHALYYCCCHARVISAILFFAMRMPYTYLSPEVLGYHAMPRAYWRAMLADARYVSACYMFRDIMLPLTIHTAPRCHIMLIMSCLNRHAIIHCCPYWCFFC